MQTSKLKQQQKYSLTDEIRLDEMSVGRVERRTVLQDRQPQPAISELRYTNELRRQLTKKGALIKMSKLDPLKS